MHPNQFKSLLTYLCQKHGADGSNARAAKVTMKWYSYDKSAVLADIASYTMFDKHELAICQKVLNGVAVSDTDINTDSYKLASSVKFYLEKCGHRYFDHM